MKEREPDKETIGRGELYFLGHPGTKDTFSGYGLTTRPESKEFLVGLLMVDRPRPPDPEWLKEVEETFGEAQLVAMTAAGERGILCQMQVEPESLPHLRRFSGAKAGAIQKALEPLLEEPPAPAFSLRWDEEARAWRSAFAMPWELPPELLEVFERTGYGSLAVETNRGVVHICHASDRDIQGFRNKPVLSRWQLIQMPTAPLIRLELAILDNPANPFRFESFLNVAAADQASVLSQLANQEELYLAFYGDDLDYRYTKVIEHDQQQWQLLDEMAEEAKRYWNALPPQKRDFDRAKAEYMRRASWGGHDKRT